MKKIVFMTVLLASGWFIAGAQVSFSINIGTQPAWGPVGYDYAEYYYLPDADAYYDINGGMFMYMYGGRWVSGPYLPGRYRNMDLYHAHKVVINERNPWMNHSRYHNQYRSYVGRHDQGAIRDSREQRYWENPGNSHHSQWRGNSVGNGGRPGDNGRRYDNNVYGRGNNGRGPREDNRRNDNNGPRQGNIYRGSDNNGRGPREDNRRNDNNGPRQGNIYHGSDNNNGRGARDDQRGNVNHGADNNGRGGNNDNHGRNEDHGGGRR